MGDQGIKKKTNYLRWLISFFFIVYLLIDLVIFKDTLTYFHYLILIFLFIIGIADRFKFIKIPGFVELKDKTESIDQKVDKIVDKIQQIQSVSINFNPQQTSQTSTSLSSGNIQHEEPTQVQPSVQPSEPRN